VHHSVYPIWFEIGRTELLRENGLAYKDLEAEGVFFVVAELNIKFRRPAHYDQTLTLETTCIEVTAGRARHTYALKDEATQQLMAEGNSVLACVDAQGKLRRMPSFMYVEK
jgi:acyl-CoA thioester hydrolase